MSESPIDAYPLAWPHGWPRTPRHQKKRGNFSTQSGSYNRPVTIREATERVTDELDRMKVTGVVISTNLAVRNDGLPRSGQRAPDDPGVAVYFIRSGSGRREVIPCDRYDDVAQNLAAVAATIAALRALDRHGTGIMERAFTGFAAIEDHSQKPKPWWIVLGVPLEAQAFQVVEAYHRRRAATHPDRGGSDDDFNEVQAAWEQYKSRGQTA